MFGECLGGVESVLGDRNFSWSVGGPGIVWEVAKKLVILVPLFWVSAFVSFTFFFMSRERLWCLESV
jgi:hypothetical protein